jgi:hypothetical protein
VANKKQQELDKVQKNARSFIDSGKWYNVESTNVLMIKYNKALRILSVRFKGVSQGIKKPIYHYKNVPPQVAGGMIVAGSKGKFVWARLRDKYDFDGPV